MKKIGRFAIDIAIVCLLGIIFFILQHSGMVWFNMPSDKSYPVKGVDVSAHQGHIKWDTLAKENIKFAFIKATEGSSWVDKHFKYNFENAKKVGLYVGAYHFFSFDSVGKTQATNFIKNVPLTTYNKMLPPVVDVEFYGTKVSNPPSAESIYKELDTLLAILEEHYGIKPVIYTTPSFYDMYLRGRYENYPLWIRSVFFAPHSFLAYIFNIHFDKSNYVFWQYNPKAILNGYSGGEKYIDLNAFNGDEKALESWLVSIRKSPSR